VRKPTRVAAAHRQAQGYGGEAQAGRGQQRRGSPGARGHAVARGAVVARACCWVDGSKERAALG